MLDYDVNVEIGGRRKSSFEYIAVWSVICANVL